MEKSSSLEPSDEQSVSTNEEVEEEEDDKLLTNRYRIYIHAANLKRQGRLRNRMPTTYAVITGPSGSNQSSTLGMTCPGVQLGQTEVVSHNCHPQFTETVCIDYMFGSKLYFFVHVFLATTQATQNQSFEQQTQEPKCLLGTARFEVGEILGTPKHTRARRLRQGGCVFCRIEPLYRNKSSSMGNLATDMDPTQYLRFRLTAKSLVLPNRKRRSMLSSNFFQHLPDMVVILSKQPDSATKKAWVIVYRSQPVCNTLDPKWELSTVDLDMLCGGDIHKHIRISVLAVRPNRAPTFLGQCETTVRYLMEAAVFRSDMNDSSNHHRVLESASEQTDGTIIEEGSEFILQRNSRKLKEVGRLAVLEASICTIDKESGSFREVVHNELHEHEQSVPETIDLAGIPVMGLPTQHRSFHDLLIKDECRFNYCVAIDYTSSNGDPISESSLHFQSNSLNDYEESILAVGKAVERYSVDQIFSVWGFGAKFGNSAVQHLFQCGRDPKVKGVDSILEAYKSVFNSGFTMSGPTVFLKVIQAAAVEAKAHHDCTTKGNINYTVLLVITDGIMDDYEETYRKLHVYKEMPLSIIFVGVGHSDFSALQRLCHDCPDNTTFVEFRSKETPSAFSLATLENLPSQVSSYVARRGLA